MDKRTRNALQAVKQELDALAHKLRQTPPQAKPPAPQAPPQRLPQALPPNWQTALQAARAMGYPAAQARAKAVQGAAANPNATEGEALRALLA